MAEMTENTSALNYAAAEPDIERIQNGMRQLIGNKAVRILPNVLSNGIRL